jgi:hypothetical protein
MIPTFFQTGRRQDNADRRCNLVDHVKGLPTHVMNLADRLGAALGEGVSVHASALSAACAFSNQNCMPISWNIVTAVSR